jgi:hypothetical protein
VIVRSYLWGEKVEFIWETDEDGLVENNLSNSADNISKSCALLAFVFAIRSSKARYFVLVENNLGPVFTRAQYSFKIN